jgi:hypothetical protein
MQTEIVTRSLTEAQLADELYGLSNLLEAGGIPSVCVEFGWGCNLPVDELWRGVTVNPGGVSEFVHRSVQAGIYAFGKCDLILQGQPTQFEIRFCHEGDIHVVAEDRQFIKRIKQRWLGKGYTAFERLGKGEWSAPQ